MEATNEPTSDDIHSLELDFAKHPTTDAFVPLCEAYLRQKRYMEAMLVCKKGIKNLPTDPRGRLLLSKVYLEQGKPPKAEQELITMMEIFPDNVDALIMQSEIYKASARKSDAIAILQRANTLQPGRADVKDSLRALGVETDVPQPVPQLQQQQMGMPQMTQQQMQMQQMQMQQMQMQQMQQMQMQQQPKNAVDAFFGEEARPVQEEFQQMPRSNTSSGHFVPPKKSNGPMILLSVVGVLVLGFGGFLFFYLTHVNNVRKIDSLLREAKPLFERNTIVGYKQSLEKYNQILEIDPESTVVLSINAYIHYWMLGAQLVQESKPLAEKFLAEANKGKDDNHYRAAANGWAKLVAGDPKGVIDTLEPEAQKYGSSLVYMTLAEAHTQLGEDAQAHDAMQKASNLAAADNATLVRTGEENLDEGKYEAAKGYFDQVLNTEGGHPGALLGRAFANIGKKQEALEAADKDYEKLSSTPGDYLSPRWKAGQLWLKGLLDTRRGKTADAKAAFEEATKLDPNNLRNLALRGKVYASAGLHAEAVKDFNAVLAKRPNQRPALVGLALSYSVLGKVAEASTVVDQLLAKDPNDAELLLVKARAQRAQGKLDDAVATYQKALAAQKGNVEAKIDMASILREKKDYPKATETLVNMIKAGEAKGRNLVLAIFELGRTYQDQGDGEKAKVSFSEVIKKDDSFPDVYFFMGKLQKGKDKKEFMQRYLQLAPAGAYASEAQKAH